MEVQARIKREDEVAKALTEARIKREEEEAKARIAAVLEGAGAASACTLCMQL